jgi:hypothetical protein
MAGGDAMAASAEERQASEQDGTLHRARQREANKRAVSVGHPRVDTQGLMELGCECINVDCERTVKVPPHVYGRMLDADQYLLQAGHHAFAQYRTIISVGLMRIEERG